MTGSKAEPAAKNNFPGVHDTLLLTSSTDLATLSSWDAPPPFGPDTAIVRSVRR